MSAALHTLPHIHQGALMRQSQALQQHMQQCRSCLGRAHHLRAWAERVHAQLAPRPVTMVLAVAALLALAGGGW